MNNFLKNRTNLADYLKIIKKINKIYKLNQGKNIFGCISYKPKQINFTQKNYTL